MFTGIIRTKGRVVSNSGARLVIKASVRGSGLGESVAINGVCLTVVRRAKGTLAFDVSPETLRLTTLGALKTGAAVHVESSMRASDLLGGHLVSGHVDARGKVLETERLKDGSLRLRFTLPKVIAPLVAKKGSIAIDGVSLTVTGVAKTWLETVLIPHTLKLTTLGRLSPGGAVNLEADMLARYVVNVLRGVRSR
ncbi:MAG: riboflavin synthase [Proteobacteria bacterium]|nr:riboflavin synthase [Pseudomonadota bacterium]